MGLASLEEIVKFWVEKVNKIDDNFWFREGASHLSIDILAKMRSINIIGDEVITEEGRIQFIKFASNEVQKVLKSPLDAPYKCYLLCRRILTNRSSKVENYKKLWKYMMQEYNLSKYNLGVEIKIEDEEEAYYCGIIEMDLKDIDVAINIASRKASRFGIFISNQKDNLTKEKLAELAPIVYKNCKNSVFHINIVAACLYLAEKGDIALRWADDSTGVELDLVYKHSAL